MVNVIFYLNCESYLCVQVVQGYHQVRGILEHPEVHFVLLLQKIQGLRELRCCRGTLEYRAHHADQGVLHVQ